jgi:very-short-patch-repair endonuclease
MVDRTRTRRARRLRKESTEAEHLLWNVLRELRLPYNVRRQHPIGEYIADFAIPRHKLIIELNGGQHAAATEEDALQTVELGKRGYRVIRFWNSDVLGNLDGVLQTIISALEAPPPLPNPLRPKGRRGNA